MALPIAEQDGSNQGDQGRDEPCLPYVTRNITPTVVDIRDEAHGLIGHHHTTEQAAINAVGYDSLSAHNPSDCRYELP